MPTVTQTSLSLKTAGYHSFHSSSISLSVSPLSHPPPLSASIAHTLFVRLFFIQHIHFVLVPWNDPYRILLTRVQNMMISRSNVSVMFVLNVDEIVDVYFIAD